MPVDFNVTAYNAVHRRVEPQSAKYPALYEHFGGGWNAVAYRFHAVADADVTFTNSVRAYGDGPAQPHRYRQERALFTFFVNGLSCIESLCYSLFAIGSMLDPHHFAMATEDDLRAVSPQSTLKSYEAAFKQESLTGELRKLVSSSDSKEWVYVRNKLAHRVAPGRIINMATHAGPVAPAEWKITPNTIFIDATTTRSRRRWLAEALSETFLSLNDFVDRMLPK